MDSTASMHAALARWFGYSGLRPGQADAVAAALEGRDALVVMPTGAGKSLCYQLPALMLPALTVVVSPLVALMEDQAAALATRAPGCVAVVHGQRGTQVNAAALARVRDGAVRLLYVAPERFGSAGFLAALGGVPVGLFVVDEAHCVSQWGHDFRPDYLRVGDAARSLGARSLLASTATATPAVARDIVERLGLRDPARVTTGFDRPNLSFAVARAADGPARTAQILAALEPPDARPAIVYAGTRRDVDALVPALAAALGVGVTGYHAGLASRERTLAQARFMNGAAEVVVATNAFGMGVDKADVRTVLHAGTPASLEAYYQEAGRAGRDGRPARALLLTAERDKGLHAHFARRATVTPAQVDAVAAALAGAAGGAVATALPGLEGPAPCFDVDLAVLERHVLLERDVVRSIAGALVRAGVLTLEPADPGRLRGRLVGPYDPAARSACQALASEAERARWTQYRAVWAWVDGRGCRRAGLLQHFGDPVGPAPSGPCCDRCDASLVAAASRPAAATAVDLDRLLAAARAEAPMPLDPATLAAVLQGRRTRAVRRDGLDALRAFGTADHLTRAELSRAIAGMAA